MYDVSKNVIKYFFEKETSLRAVDQYIHKISDDVFPYGVFFNVNWEVGTILTDHGFEISRYENHTQKTIFDIGLVYNEWVLIEADEILGH